MKLLRIFLLSITICGSLRAEGLEYMPFYLLNVMQIISFHYGFSTDLNTADSNKVSKDRFSGIVGASVGWNFFGDKKLYPEPAIPIPFSDDDIGFGIRAKYLYMNSYAPTHSVGGVLYIYPPKDLKYIFHFIIGVGANFSEINGLKANGAYIEVGLGLFKMLPFLGNTDITYRANIYSKHNDLDLGTIHSLNFVWAFF